MEPGSCDGRRRLAAAATGAAVAAMLVFYTNQMLRGPLALARAIHAQDAAGVRRAVALGTDPNCPLGPFGDPPLVAAARDSNAAVVAELAGAGSCLEARDGQGRSPVAVACIAGNTPALAALLGQGANPDSALRSGAHALHEAAGMPGAGAEMSALLLGCGADPNARDGSGQTPLHVASRSGAAAATGVLLARGADPRLREVDGRTAADLAEANGHHDLAALLREAEAGRLAPAPASESAAAGAESR